MAGRYAEAFRAEGFDVWWDVGLRSGEAYDEVTENALRGAKAVVVLWSKKSVASRWVRAEATLADRLKTLVPAMIEPCERPIMFELVQTADLSGWKGDRADPKFRAFVEDIHRRIAAGGEARPVAAASPSLAAKPAMSRRTMMIAGGAGVAVVAGAGVALWPRAKARRKGEATLAVLPFDNLSADPANAFMADGIADEVLNGMQRVKGLTVIARTSSFALREEKLSAQDIGAKLGADVLVQGSVQQSGDAVRVRVQLVEAKSARQMWSEAFQNTVDGLFGLQDEICARLVRELPNLMAVQSLMAPAGGRKPVDPETFRNLLEARDLWAKASNYGQVGLRDEADAAETRGLEIVEAELAKNPDNADALAVKAFIWIRGGSPPLQRLGRRNRYEQGKEMVERAVAGDPDSPDALALRGEIFSRFEYRWADAEYDLRRAIEVNPNHAEAQSQLGYHYSKVGWAAEALPLLEIATKLDPLYVNRKLAPPRVLPMLGREDEAVSQLKVMFEGADANFVAGRDLYYILMSRRDLAGMREVIRRLRTLQGDESPRGVQLSRMDATIEGMEGRPQAHEAFLAEFLARDADARFHSETLWSFAVETAAIGNIDRTLDVFRICIENQILYQSQFMPYGHAVPEKLAADPRWMALWTADPRLKELCDIRLQALQRRQFHGRLPDGKMVTPA